MRNQSDTTPDQPAGIPIAADPLTPTAPVAGSVLEAPTKVTPPSNNAPKMLQATMARRVVSGTIVVWMLYFFFAGTLNSLFQFHPMMMALAFVALMPEVIHASNCLRRSKNYADRLARTQTHLVLALGTKGLALAGLLVIFTNKSNRGKPHFTTWHGKIGLLVVLALAVQVALGFVYQWRLVAKLGLVRKAHKYVGIFTVAAGAVAFILGMLSNWALANVSAPLINGIFAFSAAVLGGWAYLRE